MTTRRAWSATEKFQIVLEGLVPKANIAQICRTHGISSSQFYRWREEAFAGMKQSLSGSTSLDARTRQENARLKKLVAEEALLIDRLREALEGRPLGKNESGGWPDA